MMSSDDDRRGPISLGGIAPQPLFAVAAVVLGSIFTNYDTRLIGYGISDLRGAFSLSFDEGAWLYTASVGSQIFVAPAVVWLVTTFGLRRILAVPSMLFAVVSYAIPFAKNYETLMALSIVYGLLLGTFVPATFMIIFRHLPTKWWLWAIALYAVRVGLTQDVGLAAVGLFTADIGWQWLYWQGVVIAPPMALLVYLGTPPCRINRDLLHNADWGGMLLFGASLSMLYAGLDQGNRLDWLGSGIVVGLLVGGGTLFIAFLVNEVYARHPWANIDVLFRRNIGFGLAVALFYTLTSLSNSVLVPGFLGTVTLLRPEQYGSLLLAYGALPILTLTPLSVVILRHFDARWVAAFGLSTFAAAGLLGMQLTHDWAPADFRAIVLLLSVGQVFTLTPTILTLVANSDSSRATAFSAYIQVIRVVGAEVGVALMTTWLRVREQIHSYYLGLHVAEGNSEVGHRLAALAGQLSDHGADVASARAISVISGTVAREANVFAFIDGFSLCFWLAIAGLFCVCWITRAPPGPFTPAPFGLAKALLRRCGVRLATHV
ncbi:MFS transporter [Bradyrhizobium iriomotense]|uniref:MFS transporter n=1 Tax=Bradyrhizobium iriomotense TaxID=441950 RepID=A0ABQ6ASQ0_9BRAD|nr:MFS transporter [Bradyrhizobium iriomotense]GLR85254.1 MFS transporter [Bradyrhizobium iriomotense]